MASQQSSFRDMFEYPGQGVDQRHRKFGLKGVRHHKMQQDSSRPLKQSFYDIVQKAKNIAMFTQTLKQKIAQKRSLNQHTLKPNEMEFLQNDSQLQTANIYFDHHSKSVLVFQMIFIITIFVYLWNCTFQIVFGTLIHRSLIQIIVFFVYIGHIVLFNFTQYKNQKFQFISNRNQVYSIYLKQKLIKDCVFLLTMIIQMTPLDDETSLVQLYIIVRVVSLICFLELSQTYEKIQDLLSVSNQAETLISMFKLLLKIVLFLHFLSISLNILAVVQRNNNIQATWITQNDIDLNSNIQKYIVGWYWGATILSTVGFGEITPKNNYERFFVSIVQVICCMSFGYFVNVIGSLIKLKAENQQKYEKQVRSLNRCLNFLSIQNNLKHKIRTYFFNRHVIEQVYDPNQQKQMLESLAPNLQSALIQQNNINVLKKSEIMQKFRRQTLLKLTHLMKKIILAPENIIYSRMTKDRKLFFIEKGQVQQFTDNFENSKLQKIISTYSQKGTILGWINFLIQSAYTTLAKAKIFTIAYELEQQGFISSLKNDIREYHRYLHIKQTMIQKNRRYTNKCISCDRYTHNVINCPRIHFVRNDVKKLVQQYRHLGRYINQQSKAKKFERDMLRYNWKLRNSANQLEKQGNIPQNNEQNLKVQNATIENFLKNMVFRESTMGVDKRKNSFIMIKKQSNNITQPKEQLKQSAVEIKSNFSSDQIIEEEEQIMFEKVFICQQQIKDFMPDHDISKVLLGYANKYSKKLQLQDRVRKFIKK